jgi:hypothetical protein
MVIATQISSSGPHAPTLSEKASPTFDVGIQDSAAYDFLQYHQDLFVEGSPLLPPHRPGFDVQLQLKQDAQPPTMYFKWPTAEDSAFLKEKVHELLQLGFIGPGTSHYGSHVLFVKRKDGSMRMVIDFRANNSNSRFLQSLQATDLPPIQYLICSVEFAIVLSLIHWIVLVVIGNCVFCSWDPYNVYSW